MGELLEREFVTSYKQLEVYQRAYAISLEIHKSTQSLPKHEQYELASQMRRASKSICANLAEGYGKQRASKAEFKRFIFIAIGSLEEMCVWVDYCKDLEYISQDIHVAWIQEYETIQKMLYALHRKVGA